jgi:release factor glutamine methyltransferase
VTLTIDAAWRDARDQLNSAGLTDSAALDAQILLVDTLGAHDRAYLFAHPEQALTPVQSTQYKAWIKRRLTGEPIAYIRGYKDWYDRRIIVTPDVLIPRPETELLLEAALEITREQPAPTVADVCTGSGAIAVTLKANAPHANVIATDISEAALAVARRNTETANVDVTFHPGNLLAPLRENGIKVDVLVSNPPYIAHDEMVQLPVSQHEPHLALDGGDDGLDFVRQLLTGTRGVCNPGAWLLMEIGSDQGKAVLQLAHDLLRPQSAKIVPDYAGLDRFLQAQL